VTAALIYPPVRDGYNFAPAYNTIEVKLDGGRSRKRLDILGGTHMVSAQWILTQAQYSRFMGFFRSTLANGTLPFLVDLLTDTAVVMPHIARCVGYLPKLTQQRGQAYWVTADLEVDANAAFTAGTGTELLVEVNPGVDMSGVGLLSVVPYLSVGQSFMILDGDATAFSVSPPALDLSGTFVVASTAITPGVSATIHYSAGGDYNTLAFLTPDFAVMPTATVVVIPT
jgi:hypothetical protein